MPWELLPVAGASFAAGFIAGFYSGGALHDLGDRQVRLYISLFISVVWGVSVTAGILLGQQYSPSLALHGIMGAVAGYFFKTAQPITRAEEGNE